jgi:hypothetical protein
MKIDDFLILDKNNEVKYQQKNIKNTFHQEGEEYILNALFKGKDNIPDIGYWVGLDTRQAVSRTDTLASINGEPFNYTDGINSGLTGYQRKNIPFTNWSITPPGVSTPYYATSGSIIFSAVNYKFNSVTNIFLATTNETNCNSIQCVGKLISTASLGTTVSVAAGESVVMSMSISLYDY